MACIPNCQQCETVASTTRCKVCEKGFQLIDTDGEICAACQYADCGTIAPCGDFYYWSDYHSACLPKPRFCEDVTGNGECEQCKDGYEPLNQDVSQCIKRITGCEEYSESGTCNQCVDGLFEPYCKACSMNCRRCDDEFFCQECVPEFELEHSESTGMQYCKVPNGGSCLSDDECLEKDECFRGICGRKYKEDCILDMEDGFEEVVCSQRYQCLDGICYRLNGTVTNCAEYFSGNQFCSQCKKGYTLNIETNSCIACPYRCAVCGPNEYCLECENWWTESIEGKCRLTEEITYLIIAIFYICAAIISVWATHQLYFRETRRIAVQ